MKVLILEDEEILRSSMKRGISSLENVDVTDAGTLEDALKALDAEIPDLIFSDIDLPDRSGLELLPELEKRQLLIPVVFISAYLQQFGSQIPLHESIQVREKPISISELRKMVLERQQQVTPETKSTPAPFGLMDYIQIACQGNYSVKIRVLNRENHTELGRILINRGKVWTAKDDEGQGEQAFQRLTLKDETAIECLTLNEDPGEQNIFNDWMELFLEGARLADESTSPKEEDEIVTDALFSEFIEETKNENATSVEIEDDNGEDAEKSGVKTSEAPSLKTDTRKPKRTVEDFLREQEELLRDTPNDMDELDGEVLSDNEIMTDEAELSEMSFEDIWEAAIDALLMKNHQQALRYFKEAKEIRPKHQGVIANLSRLAEMGYE